MKVGGVPEHFNLPWHQLAEKSPELLTWTDVPGGTGALATMIADGELDVATLLTEGAVAAINSRGMPGVITDVWVSTPLQWGVHVASGSPFMSEDMLEGAKIAISRPGSGSQLMAYVQASRLGWKLSAEQFVALGGLDGALVGLPNGEADQFLWDRFMTNPHVTSGVFRRVAVQPTPWPSFVVVVSHDAMANQREAVADVVGQAFALADSLTASGAVARIVSERYGLATETAKQWWETTSWHQPESAESLNVAEVIADTEKQLIDFGVLDQAIDLDHYLRLA